MGDPKVSEGTGRQIAAFAKHLPRYLQVIGQNIGPYLQSQVNARGTIDPQQAALDESLLKYFGPRMTDVGLGLQRQGAFGTAQNELDVLKGPGAELVAAGKQLEEYQDPEYFATRAAGGQKLLDLLGGQDPNKLTGAEEANVERGLNRMNIGAGTYGTQSGTGTVNAAMTFGDALDRKRNTLLNTINSIPSNLAAFKTGKDVFQVATGRSSMPNPGFAQYQTGRQGFGQDVAGLGSGLLGETGQNVRSAQELNANRRDILDRVNETMSSLPSD